MNKLRTYEGGCHCGRVRFRVTADLETVSICNCSICTKKGIIHLIVPPERFELVCGKDDLTTYCAPVADHQYEVSAENRGTIFEFPNSARSD